MKKRDLKDLIRHCRIHAGYTDCGYLQMTTEQKALYDRVIGRVSPLYDRFDENQRERYDKVRGKKQRGEVQGW